MPRKQLIIGNKREEVHNKPLDVAENPSNAKKKPGAHRPGIIGDSGAMKKPGTDRPGIIGDSRVEGARRLGPQPNTSRIASPISVYTVNSSYQKGNGACMQKLSGDKDMNS